MAAPPCRRERSSGDIWQPLRTASSSLETLVEIRWGLYNYNMLLTEKYSCNDGKLNWFIMYTCYKYQHLVGGFKHVLFFHILEIILPTDNLLIFFRGVQTTNQTCYPLVVLRSELENLHAIFMGKLTSFRLGHCPSLC